MKLPMKLLRIAGLCLALVSMFAVSMAVSAAASAAEARWEQCSEGPANTEPPTKYSEHQCVTAEKPGKWQWNEVTGTEAVVIKGSLLLKDTLTGGGSEVECYGEAEGLVGPKNLDKVTKVTVLSCRPIKVCETTKPASAEAVDLPWQTEVYQTEGKKFESLTEDGKGEPGWAVKCKVAGLASTDTCTAEGPESLELANKSTGGETPLLVLATFQHLRKAKCSIGGAKAGEVMGSTAILKANKWGLRVT